MTQNSSKPSGGWNMTSLMNDLATAWRLVKDPRVPGILKLILPVAGLLYLISPLDLLPGPVDDIAVLFVALRLFLQMAPSAAVNDARGATGTRSSNNDDDTIDTTWRVVDDK